MCVAVNYDDRWYQTPVELASLIGGMSRLKWCGDVVRSSDPCLCSVDIARTLSQAGYELTRGADPMQWFAFKRDNSD